MYTKKWIPVWDLTQTDACSFNFIIPCFRFDYGDPDFDKICDSLNFLIKYNMLISFPNMIPWTSFTMLFVSITRLLAYCYSIIICVLTTIVQPDLFTSRFFIRRAYIYGWPKQNCILKWRLNFFPINLIDSIVNWKCFICVLGQQER